MRIDKWLWSVRMYRTRTKAADACKGSHVRINGKVIKPASVVRIGNEISINYPRITRTLKVVDLLAKRVGAPIAIKCYDDLTPESEYEKLHSQTKAQSIITRDRGSGRPTKKDRREMEKWLDDFDLELDWD